MTSTLTESSTNIGSIFVVGGIHQHHQYAKKYTYKRMGEIYHHLKPDVLCVEIEQKYLDDGSDHGMPYDFLKFMVPQARKDSIPIFGIDWWDSEKGKKWQQLQQKASEDPALSVENKLVNGMFEMLNEYFQEKDFEEINSSLISDLWAAKNNFKYSVFQKYTKYRFIVEYENERNKHMLKYIMQVIESYQEKRILVAVGIDHKYYIEQRLREQGIHVLNVKEVINEWWT